MRKKHPEKLKTFEEVKNTEFKEEPEEPKKYYSYFDEDDIHIFTNTKYDPDGFHMKGLHKDTENKYDPNGFDMKGLHKDTENKYDPDGFDMKGLHKDTNTFLNKEKSIRKDISKNINWLNDKDEFLKLYHKIIKNGDKNISISYDKNKSKFNTEKITKSLKKLRNKLINPSEFKEEYNKFLDSIEKFKNYKSEKETGSVSPNQKKMIRYARDLKDIIDLYNLKSDSDTSKKGEGLKILTDKQMLNRLPILLAQIEAGNNLIKLKNEARQILYSLYRSKVLTKTVYNNLIKSIRA